MGQRKENGAQATVNANKNTRHGRLTSTEARLPQPARPVFSRSPHPMRILPWLFLPLCIAGAATPPMPKLLFFANPMTSDNDVVRRPKPDVLSVAERHFQSLTAGVFDVTITQDGSALGNRDAISRYQVIVFFTAINPPGVDLDALLAWVRDGGAFIGIHSTANTYQKHPGFGELLGARYDRRPWRTAAAPQTKVRVKVDHRTHPSTRHFGASFEIADDIYQFKAFDPTQITVLLSLDPSSLDLRHPKMNRDDRVLPVAWTKVYGRGRVFYTALGDWEPTWTDPRYRTHLIEGIRWALAKAPAP